MFFIFAPSINKDIIKIPYYKNVEFFCQNLVYIVLKRGRCIIQSKKYYLVLKMAITGLKNRFLFITFLNPHLIVAIGLIELDEILNPI